MASIVSRRRGLLLAVIGIAVSSALVGWLLGRSIASPADIAADSDPPEASLITVPVELRELSTTVVLRGDVVLEGSLDITVDSTAGAETGGVAVVTGTPLAQDDIVEEGSVLLEVGERPVIALQGVLPMFRTLGPGSQGDDVLQLEEALARLGFDPGISDGTYDEATERAIDAFYVQLGYAPTGITDDEREALDLARDAVRDANVQVNDAQATLERAREPLSESARLEAVASRDAAQAHLRTAQAVAQESRAEAAATTANAVVERNEANEAAALASQRLAEAESGTHPDTGVAPTPEELATLTTERDHAADEHVRASAAVTAAEAAEARVVSEHDAAVAQARTDLAIAEARHGEQTAPADTTGEARALADARERLRDASADLAELERETGIGVPRAEIIFLDVLPRRVQRLAVARGDVISAAAMTVSGADVTIESSISANDRALVNVGDTAVLDDESLGVRFEAEITQLATDAGGRAAEGRYYVELRPLDDPGSEVAGLNLRATIDITSTGGQVLTVPLAALSAGGDGSVRIEVETDEPGVTRWVIVTTGLQTTGFVEVHPVEGSLEAGDRVVVGR